MPLFNCLCIMSSYSFSEALLAPSTTSSSALEVLRGAHYFPPLHSSLSSVSLHILLYGISLLTACIALGYSIISPIINGLAVLAFFLFYQLYKYLFLYQFTQSPATDTGGLFYPRAIQHVFVGMYVQQICLCALFFLARDENNHASAVPEGILMVVLIFLTVS